MNDGNVIRINFRRLPEQRRKELVKKVKSKARITRSSFNIRRDMMEQMKKIEKEALITRTT